MVFDGFLDRALGAAADAARRPGEPVVAHYTDHGRALFAPESADINLDDPSEWDEATWLYGQTVNLAEVR